MKEQLILQVESISLLPAQINTLRCICYSVFGQQLIYCII